MKQAKKHPITHSELQGTMVAVIMALSISLSLKKTLPHILQESIPITEHDVHCVCSSRTLSVGQKCRG
jgi:starvation-inducible outer membrane lipoprotein